VSTLLPSLPPFLLLYPPSLPPSLPYLYSRPLSLLITARRSRNPSSILASFIFFRLCAAKSAADPLPVEEG